MSVSSSLLSRESIPLPYLLGTSATATSISSPTHLKLLPYLCYNWRDLLLQPVAFLARIFFASVGDMQWCKFFVAVGEIYPWRFLLELRRATTRVATCVPVAWTRAMLPPCTIEAMISSRRSHNQFLGGCYNRAHQNNKWRRCYGQMLQLCIIGVATSYRCY